MDSVLSLFAQHDLLAVFLAVFAATLGIPVPALPLLLLAGAEAVTAGLYGVEALGAATLASTLAGSIWFGMGRRLGRRTLSLLCRVSISPDTCVRQSELSFARRGAATLVIAKFVPGLSILAPPLAGALGMRALTFLSFTSAGGLLWAGGGMAIGMVFHRQIGQFLIALSSLGRAAVIPAAGLLALYIAVRLWRRWLAARALARISRIEPNDLADLIGQGDAVVIVDVRALAMRSDAMLSIPGARHIELGGIESAPIEAWPVELEIVVYCDCPNDASAAKAAQLLGRRGRKARVLTGGLDGWTRAGFPVGTS